MSDDNVYAFRSARSQAFDLCDDMNRRMSANARARGLRWYVDGANQCYLAFTPEEQKAHGERIKRANEEAIRRHREWNDVNRPPQWWEEKD